MTSALRWIKTIGWNWLELDGIEWNWNWNWNRNWTIELNWIDLNWIELNWIELNWIELNWMKLNGIVELNGIEWNWMEFNGIEWNWTKLNGIELLLMYVLNAAGSQSKWIDRFKQNRNEYQFSSLFEIVHFLYFIIIKKRCKSKFLLKESINSL